MRILFPLFFVCAFGFTYTHKPFEFTHELHKDRQRLQIEIEEVLVTRWGIIIDTFNPNFVDVHYDVKTVPCLMYGSIKCNMREAGLLSARSRGHVILNDCYCVQKIALCSVWPEDIKRLGHLAFKTADCYTNCYTKNTTII